MEKIYAPWRDQYIEEHIKNKSLDSQKKECIFCTVFDVKNSPEERFILYRSADIAVLFNLYPYAAGHLLIITRYHQEAFHTLPQEVQYQYVQAISISSQIIKEQLSAEGLNIGANIGKAAGAGIPDHLHTHIVPRWLGDTNFLPILSDTKQISVDLKKIYNKLLPFFIEAFSERR